MIFLVTLFCFSFRPEERALNEKNADPELNSAATKLQAAHRGKAARNEIAEH